MKYLDCLVAVLVVIGAINWGCIGFFNFNLVQFFFTNHVVERVIYAAVGVAGCYLVVFNKACRSKVCKK
ncbi:MAG: DUF378 domain-containing protein [Chlamydiales bacterium]|nr:DUF378 domain-containing protein [Chlamydiales bacterium]